MTRRLIPVALLSAGLLAFGLQPAPAAGSSGPSGPDVAKLDGGLKILAEAAESGRPVTSQTSMDAGNGVKVLTGARVDDGDVLVDVYVNGSLADAESALRGLGMRVTATNDKAPQRLVAGWLPATELLDATALGATKAIRTVRAGKDAADGTDTGSVLSQGDAAHHGPQARALGVSGAGVKVGVISDSINKVAGGVAASQASGNLPPAPGVHVLLDDPQAGTIDEGRAMAEIIYDEAPGLTDIYFSTGTVSAAGKAASINNLVAQGVKIIADDIFYLDEPMFQDGQVAQAVDAAKAAGVNYFASAGNRARQSWEGTMSAGADNDFDLSGADRHRPDHRHLQRRLAVRVAAVGRAVGRRHHRPVARLVRRRRPGRLAGRRTTSPPASPTSSSRSACRPGRTRSASASTGSAGTGTPKLKYIAGGAHVHASPSTPPAPTRSTRTPHPRPARWPSPPASGPRRPRPRPSARAVRRSRATSTSSGSRSARRSSGPSRPSRRPTACRRPCRP